VANLDFKVYTQDGFKFKGIKRFDTLEELMGFIKLHEKCSVTVSVDEIFVSNIGQDDLF